MLGEAQVHARVIDLIRYATDAGPYRMFPTGNRADFGHRPGDQPTEHALLSGAHASSHDTVQSRVPTVCRTPVGTMPRAYQKQRCGGWNAAHPPSATAVPAREQPAERRENLGRSCPLP